jgi:hypothetical protein
MLGSIERKGRVKPEAPTTPAAATGEARAPVHHPHVGRCGHAFYVDEGTSCSDARLSSSSAGVRRRLWRCAILATLHPSERENVAAPQPDPAGVEHTSAWIRGSGDRRRRVSVGAAIVAVLATLALFLAFRWHDPQPYSGDEPHYLLVSQSLILDGDVDVKNDYLRRRYLEYYTGHLDPHVNTSIFTRASPHWYSMHGVGLSAVLVPAVAADGAHGASVAMVAVAVIVLLLTFVWVRRFTGEAWLAAIATAALGFAPAFLSLEGRVFPDLTAAALLLGCLLVLELPERRSRDLLLLGVLVGVSPWFHFKNLLAFGTIAAIAFVQVMRRSEGRERVRRLLSLLTPLIVSAVGYELSIRVWYAAWLPTRMVLPGNEVFALSEPRGLAAVSFDSARGLFTNNPALLLILAGLPVWFRLYRGPVLRLALVLGPTILLQATFSDWSGAYSPAGRYALQFVPALIPAIALLLREASVPVRALATALLSLQWALALAFIWLRPPWGVVGKRSPLLTAIDEHHGPPLDRAMPTFDAYTGFVHGGWQLAAWVLASGLLVWYGARRVRLGGASA